MLADPLEHTPLPRLFSPRAAPPTSLSASVQPSPLPDSPAGAPVSSSAAAAAAAAIEPSNPEADKDPAPSPSPPVRSKALILIAVFYLLVAILISTAISSTTWAYGAATCVDLNVLVEINCGVLTFDLVQTSLQTGQRLDRLSLTDEMYDASRDSLEAKAKQTGIVTLGFGILAFLACLACAGFSLIHYHYGSSHWTLGSRSLVLLTGKLATLAGVVASCLLGAETAANPILKGSHQDIYSFLQARVQRDVQMPSQIVSELGSSFALNLFNIGFASSGCLLLLYLLQRTSQLYKNHHA